ncbi:MAG TPA: alkaline phosphatase family protein, partial [Geodermatophilus sp.]|nr:alkaline phosphatase family protein [Geodermatophilus sp.]
RVPSSEVDWTKRAGQYFGNQLGELVLHDRQATFRLFISELDEGRERLRLVADLPLSAPATAEVTG